MMHEVVFLNEKNVLPEKYEQIPLEKTSGISTMEQVTTWLETAYTSTKLDNTITGKVRFGDDSRIDIKGKGTISFSDMNGDSRKMTEVYFILDLKSNIISLVKATEAGCDIRMRGEKLTMHDQQGKLLVTAKRSKNRLYKVCMGIKNVPCLYLNAEKESSRWHACLGHINHETLRSMIQKEIVLGIPSIEIEKQVCGSCLLGKQARRMFPKATSYRAEKALELFHGDP